MDALAAILLIKHLEKGKSKLTPIEPSMAREAKLPVYRVVRDSSGEALICHVSRIDYISFLKNRYDLVSKRQNLRNILCRTIS